MVPISSNEVIFLGGIKEVHGIGEVSLLNLADLTWQVVVEEDSNCFFAEFNLFNLSKDGEITAIV